MGDGCAVCWEETDAAKTLICDNCDQEYHMYCLDPPLTELPTQDGTPPPPFSYTDHALQGISARLLKLVPF